MNKNKIYRLSIFIMLFCALALIPWHVEATVESKLVRVGYADIDNFIEEKDGRISGYGVAYLEKIARYTGWQYEYRRGTWEECLQWVESGEVDVTLPAEYSKERAETYLYSKQECMLDFTAVYTLKERNDIFYQDIDSLNGLTIGMIRGNFLNDSFDKFASEQGLNVHRKYFADKKEMNEVLDKGLVDAVVSGNFICTPNHKIVSKIDYMPAYFIMNKHKQVLMAQLDQAVYNIMLENPYFMTSLYDKYYGKNNRIAQGLTKQEAEFVQNAAPIKIVCHNSRYPLEWYDEKNSKYQGVYQDILQMITENTGLRFQPIYTPSFENAWEMVRDGKADMISGIVESNVAKNQYKLTLTEEFLSENYSLIARRENKLDEKAKLSLALSKQFIGLQSYVKEKYPNWKIIPVEDIFSGLQMVADNQVDMTLMNDVILTSNDYLSDYSNLVQVSALSFTVPMVFGISQQYAPELQGVLNKGISKIETTKIQKSILEKSSLRQQHTSLISLAKSNLPQAFIVVIGFMLLIMIGVILVYRNRLQEKLNKQLRKALNIAQEERVRAERANCAKSDFLSKMSHEIRTPINAIMGMATIAKWHASDVARVQDCAEKISNASNHLGALVDDILDMSRIEKGKMFLDAKNTALKQLVQNTYEMMLVTAKEKGVKLLLEVEGLPDENIVIDAKRLQQVLLNLLSNAIKFTATGGVVSLKVNLLARDSHKLELRFMVQDNGIGIHADQQTDIFEAFNQGNRAIYSDYGGTGLGLTVSQNIMALMHSKINLESVQGEGSSFWFDLEVPIVEAALASEQAADAGKLQIPDLHGYRILIVEDNAVNMEILCELLQVTGAEITKALNGEEAVNTFLASEVFYYDIILMDIRMPKLDGYQATKMIRKLTREDANHVYIMAMTADALTNDIETALACGMNQHLRKPIDIKYFFELLQSWKDNIK